MLKKHREKRCAPIKEHRKKWSMTPLQNKSKRRISKQGVLRKTNKNIPHTCTSRSSCMTSFFLDPVFGSTTSCGTSESHTYPTQSSTYKPQSRKLRLDKSLWWGNKYHFSDRGNHPRNLVLLCKIFKTSEIGSRKEEEQEMQSQKLFYSQTSKGKVESYKHHR
jgi:hypothetical protein